MIIRQKGKKFYAIIRKNGHEKWFGGETIEEAINNINKKYNVSNYIKYYLNNITVRENTKNFYHYALKSLCNLYGKKTIKTTNDNRRINLAMQIRRMRNADVVEAARQRGVIFGSSTISQYQNGRYTPKPDKVKILAEIFNVSYLWLLGLAPVREINYQDGDTPEEKELLQNFRKLSKNNQKIVLNNIKMMLKYSK